MKEELMANITKKNLSEFIRNKLSTNDKWAKKALLEIYKRQTPVEQESQQTIVHNDIGFSGVDAELLSSYAKQLEASQWLSSKQMLWLKKKIVKYWRQIMEISDKAKLIALYEQEELYAQTNLFPKD
jgi:hypothetical protein